jgi:hypothetical protein
MSTVVPLYSPARAAVSAAFGTTALGEGLAPLDAVGLATGLGDGEAASSAHAPTTIAIAARPARVFLARMMLCLTPLSLHVPVRS